MQYNKKKSYVLFYLFFNKIYFKTTVKSKRYWLVILSKYSNIESLVLLCRLSGWSVITVSNWSCCGTWTSGSIGGSVSFLCLARLCKIAVATIISCASEILQRSPILKTGNLLFQTPKHLSITFLVRI